MIQKLFVIPSILGVILLLPVMLVRCKTAKPRDQKPKPRMTWSNPVGKPEESNKSTTNNEIKVDIPKVDQLKADKSKGDSTKLNDSKKDKKESKNETLEKKNPEEVDKKSKEQGQEKQEESKSTQKTGSQRSTKDSVKKGPSVDPHELRWTAEGGSQKLVLTNESNKRIALKVKCSDNEIYRITPVFAFVDAGAKIELEVVRNKADVKAEKVVVLVLEAPVEATDPALLFKTTTTTTTTPTSFIVTMITS